MLVGSRLCVKTNTEVKQDEHEEVDPLLSS